MYAIEKNVPLPNRAGPAKNVELLNTLGNMEVGDSFVVTAKGDEKLNTTRNRVWGTINKFRAEHAGYKFASRVEDNEAGVRFWRIA